MKTDPNKAYNQDDAIGFIRLNALRLKVVARLQREGESDFQFRAAHLFSA